MTNKKKTILSISCPVFHVGVVYAFVKQFSQRDIMDSASLTGYFSPLILSFIPKNSKNSFILLIRV